LAASNSARVFSAASSGAALARRVLRVACMRK
jgi:hypothetical protein